MRYPIHDIIAQYDFDITDISDITDTIHPKVPV